MHIRKFFCHSASPRQPVTEFRTIQSEKKAKKWTVFRMLWYTSLSAPSGMFYGCSSLSDIKPLQNWNVSNGNNFSHMFSGCSSLLDIKALQNWNVSNGNNFSNMFSYCSSLSDITPLQNWNVSNGNNFSNMFYNCSSLSDIKF